MFKFEITGETESMDQESAIRREIEFFAASLSNKFPMVIQSADFSGDKTEDNKDLHKKGVVT